MKLPAGYYSHQVASEDDVEGSLFRKLLASHSLEIVKNVVYQSGEQNWYLLRVPQDLDLDVVAYWVWMSKFREARPDSKPEDTLSSNELETSGFPVAEALDDGIKATKDAAKALTPSFAAIATGAAIVFLLGRLLR